jgi:hypothetical protein
MHVAGTTKHQRIQPMSFHAGEHFCTSLAAQQRKINAGVIFEAHHPDKHTVVARRGAHAPKP